MSKESHDKLNQIESFGRILLNKKNMKKAVCFGEVLWDIFPGKERIGGAPLNVASRLCSLGFNTEIISQVGDDEKGKKILSYLSSNKVGIQNISVDDQYPTGTVNVSLSPEGSATYEIAYPAAWDKIHLTTEKVKAVEESDVFVYGSLICRDVISKMTLFELLPKARFKVLDFNLRAPHYTSELLLKLIQYADFIKFNDEELSEIATLMGSKFNSIEQNISFVSKQTNASSICVTMGSKGAILLHDGQWYSNGGYKISVKDTVGAGDSFLATLLVKIMSGMEVQKSLDYACAIGALVASQEGANPMLDEAVINSLMFPKG